MSVIGCWLNNLICYWLLDLINMSAFVCCLFNNRVYFVSTFVCLIILSTSVCYTCDPLYLRDNLGLHPSSSSDFSAKSLFLSNYFYCFHHLFLLYAVYQTFKTKKTKKLPTLNHRFINLILSRGFHNFSSFFSIKNSQKATLCLNMAYVLVSVKNVR